MSDGDENRLLGSVQCEQQFGDAAHHERELGRALAAQAAQRRPAAPAAAPTPAAAG